MMHRRRIYLVDRKLQVAVAVQLLGVLAGVAVLYVVGVLLVAGEGGPDRLTAGEVLRANAIYLLLAAALLGLTALLITHRIAGPAFVVERALRGLARGDHSMRVSLRKRDHLKPLAAAVEDLRAELERRASLCGELKSALDRGDLDAARAIAARLAPAGAQAPEPETAAR